MVFSFGSGRDEHDPCLRGIAIEDEQRAAGWIGETENGVSSQAMQSGNSALAGK